MSGEFGEDFKPVVKGDENQEADSLADFRLAKPGDTKAASGAGAETKSGTDDSALKKALNGYKPEEHGDYANYCEKHCTPEQNQAIIENLIKSMKAKMEKLTGPQADAKVSDATQKQVEDLMAAFKKAMA